MHEHETHINIFCISAFSLGMDYYVHHYPYLQFKVFIVSSISLYGLYPDPVIIPDQSVA